MRHTLGLEATARDHCHCQLPRFRRLFALPKSLKPEEGMQVAATTPPQLHFSPLHSTPFVEGSHHVDLEDSSKSIVKHPLVQKEGAHFGPNMSTLGPILLGLTRGSWPYY